MGRSALGRLALIARPQWPRLAMAMAFLVAGSGLSLAFPQAARVVIDEALARGDVRLIDRVAIALVAVCALQGGAVALRAYLFTSVGERTVAQLRARLYAGLVEQEVAFFDASRVGELLSRLGSDASMLQTTVAQNVSVALRNGVMVAGSVALLVYISPSLALLLLLLVPAVGGAATAYGQRVRRTARLAQDALAEASAVAEEGLGAIRTVRAYAAEAVEAARYGGAVKRALELGLRRARISSTFTGAMVAAGYGGVAAIFWHGGHLVARGQLSVGQLTSFLMYSLFVAVGVGALGEVWGELSRASGAAERVFDLLDRRPELPSKGVVPDGTEGRVRFEGVGFAYPARAGQAVLDGLDLELAPNQMVALVGPSGAGKSTVAALLIRLYDPDRGRVLLDGRDVRELDASWLRRQIVVVSQEPTLFSVSVADNIRYARPEASDAEVEEAARAANAHDFVAAFPEGYRTLVGERGARLSAGQKQRIAIARAVLKDPRILVLDEATSALDGESERLVQTALRRVMRGRTTLVIAHRLSTVVEADTIYVLHAGRVVQSGSHAGLLASGGLYRKLVDRQFVAA